MSASVLLAAAAGALIGAGTMDLGAAAATAGRRRRPRRRSPLRLIAGVGRRMGVAAAPHDLADRIAAAGAPLSVGDVMALRSGAGLAGALAALPLAALLPGRLGLLAPAAAAGAGFLLPGAWLRRRVHARAATMGSELADVADLLRVATDAGLPVRRALREVGRRHRGALAAELRRTAAELDLGVPRRMALATLRTRVPLESAAALHAALEGAERLGTPSSEALRALAAGARAQQHRALAEQAARASPRVQLVVALVLVPSSLLLIAAALLPALGV